MKGKSFLLILLIFGLLSLGEAVSFYTDWLWFQSVGYASVFSTVVKTQFLASALFGLGFAVVIFVNTYLASRFAPDDTVVFLENPLLGLPDRRLVTPYLKALLVPGCLVIGLFAALSFAGNWNTVLLFFSSSPFHVADPLFGKDIGFYVFKLPFLRLLYGGAMAALTLGLLAAVAIYLINRGIHILPRGIGFTQAARAHLLVAAGILLALKAWGYRLESYDLLYSPRGVAFGASYADVHAELPILNVLILLALACAVVFFASSFLRTWKWPAVAAGALAAVAILGKGLYPGLVQRFSVVPNELTKERPYIALNIKYTRQAFGLNNIQEKEFPADQGLTWKDIQRNEATVQNIRLWAVRPLLASYAQLQEIRTYYKFVDIDVDRYMINGQDRQVTLSPRELSYNDLPSKIWINEHLNYTHGYGVVMGPVNRVTQEGIPEFFIKDIPPRSRSGVVQIRRPEIYYGEIPNDYVFVKTRAREFDYPSGDQNVYTTYAGTGGVPLSSFWRKVLFSARLGTLKVLLSNDLTPQSRIMIYRDIRERTQRIAPFLRYDADPYMVISPEGRLFWIMDAYTVSSMYPYSQPVRGVGNYIRNSVKVVIDAYNGTVRFYVSAPRDPIIQTYSRIFPGLFRPLESMPAGLKPHLRYPEGLFSVQAQVYATYHMQDPQVFYNKEDLWSLPRGGAEGQPMEPYYMIMRLPGEPSEEFILMIPFTPSQKDNMSAWLAARCDPPNYGKLIVYTFPKDKLVYGPRQIEARIDQNPGISQQLSLWNQRGSRVIRGHLLVIPIDTSLLYVEPLYLAASEGQLPELKRVILSYGDRIVMEQNLDQAMAALFHAGAPVAVAPSGAPAPEKGSAAKRARDALEAYNRALKFLREGNWAGYGQEIGRVGQALRELSGQSP